VGDTRPQVSEETRRRIKTRCAWMGLSVSALARRMGYRSDNFFHALRGRYRYVLPIQKVAEHLEVPLEALMPDGPREPLTSDYTTAVG